MLPSKLCVNADFDAEWFRAWRPLMSHHTANGITLGGSFRHRKEWELVFTCQALDERGLLQPGMRGIGFAVGREPLPALFASRGCCILASDSSTDSDGTWRGQWASCRADLSRPEICEPSIFARAVEFERIDMNDLPAEHDNEFDFSWSCCALEHLGSLAKGLSFLMKQMRCLKPGGTAIHTMEYNLSSNCSTLRTGTTVLYRRMDIESFVDFVISAGHAVEPVDFFEGRDANDKFVAEEPWDDVTRNIAHLRLNVGGFVCTSLALIMKKAIT